MADSDNPCPAWNDSWALNIKLWIYQIFCETLFYGLFAAVFFFSSTILLQQSLRKSHARLALFLCTLVMFLVSTVHLILHIVQYIVQVPYICNVDGLPSDVQEIWNATYAGLALLERMQYLISDAIVVWRAVVIWPKNWWVIGGMSFCLFVTAVTSIYLAVLNVLTVTIPHEYSTVEKNMLGTFPLMFTNAIATILIAYKTWIYRRTVGRYLDSGSSRTRVEGVLILLVESGLFYFVYWIFIACSDYSLFGQFEFEWFQPNISGIYPTLIVIAVSLKKSAPDIIYPLSQAPSGTNAHAISHSLQFNAFPVLSTSADVDPDVDDDFGTSGSSSKARDRERDYGIGTEYTSSSGRSGRSGSAKSRSRSKVERMGFGTGSTHNAGIGGPGAGRGLKGSFGSKMDDHLRHHPFGLYEDDEAGLELEERERSKASLRHVTEADLGVEIEIETESATAVGEGEGSRGAVDGMGGFGSKAGIHSKDGIEIGSGGALGLDLGPRIEASTGAGMDIGSEPREEWERDSVSFSVESTGPG